MVKNDIILIAAVLLIAAIALTCLVLFRQDGQQVAVYVDKELYGKYPLEQDVTVEINTEYGKNVLVISDGTATVTEATCPDLICVNHRAISFEGEQIVCLPNKVVVSIE